MEKAWNLDWSSLHFVVVVLMLQTVLHCYQRNHIALVIALIPNIMLLVLAVKGNDHVFLPFGIFMQPLYEEGWWTPSVNVEVNEEDAAVEAVEVMEHDAPAVT